MSKDAYINTPLHKIGKIITGKTPSTAREDFYGGEYLFISPTELHDGYSIEKSNKTITEKGFQSIRNNTLQGTSVLVGCIGWDMGNVAMCHKTCATNQQINSITNFNDNANPFYVYYWLSTKKEYLFSIASVTRTPILNKSTFEKIEIPLPKRSIQDTIANFLKILDDKIACNNRINAELESMAKTLYDYWFVQFDFPDVNGKPYKSSNGKMVYNEELKSEIPEGWEVGSLWDIARYHNGLAMQKYRPTGNDFLPVIKIREMNEGISANTEKATLALPPTAIIDNGDVLFSWSATLDVKIWTQGKAALNQHIFKVVSEKYPRTFFYFELLSYLNHFKMMAEKRKTTMGHITLDHLKQSKICIPPKTLILQIHKKINPILEKYILLQQENQQLAKLRDWLLPMLMNGQVTANI